MDASNPTHLQRALASAPDGDVFQHLPVEWWDQTASVWRPSILIGAGDHAAPRTHFEIAIPDLSHESVAEEPARRVAIDELRLAQEIPAALLKFYSARYTLSMLDSLMPCIARASDEEQHALRGVLTDILQVYSDNHDVWAKAFLVGRRDSGPVAEAPNVFAGGRMELRGRRAGLSLGGRARNIFTVLENDSEGTDLSCAPVALYDEELRVWRPTMVIGAVDDEAQYYPSSDVRVLVPADPVDVITVPGSLLDPLDIGDTCFALFAIPVVARDLLRMHRALRQSGLDERARNAHPMLRAVAAMLRGATEEWRAAFSAGMRGAPPQPRVVPLSPGAWFAPTVVAGAEA
jgi:hypothetical protein